MALEVPAPDPPSLHGPQPRGEYEAIDNPVAEPGDDYRREELEAILADGAWADAFDEWAAGAGLSVDAYEVLVEHDAFEDLDFYWDATTDEVGYVTPSLSDDVRDRVSGEVDDVEDELDDLARVVSETLENDYLLRDEETYGFFADDEPGDEYGHRDED